MVTKKLIKNKKSDALEVFNSLAVDFLKTGGSFDFPITLETNEKGEITNKDVFSYYFNNYPFKLQVKQLFTDLPELKFYSKPLEKPRNFSSYGKGKFLLSFFELIPYENSDITKRTAGKPVKTINGKKTNCLTFHIARVCDENGVKLPKTTGSIKLTEDSYLSFGFTKQLLVVAKEFYNELSKIYIYKKGRDISSRIELFNSIYPYKDYLDKNLNECRAKNLESEELAKYTNLIKYKYETLRNLIIEKCVMFLNMLDEMNDHVKLHNSKHNLVHELSDGLDSNLNESFNSPTKISTVHIGIPYLVVSQLKKLDVYLTLHKVLKEENLDLLVDYISQILLNSIVENKGLKLNQGKLYKLSHINSLGKQFYKIAKSIEYNSEQNCKTLQQEISLNLFKNEISNSNKNILVLLDGTLIKSKAKNIFYNSYSVSKIDGLIKCFKLTLMQTDTGIPLLMDTSSSSRKDVTDFTHLLDHLKDMKVDTDRIILCADAGYFSQFNQVYSQSLNIKYLLLSRDINVVMDSILEKSRGYKAIYFNAKTQVSVFSKAIKYSDYVCANPYYVEELEDRQQQKYNSAYSIKDINDHDLKIVNIFNTEVHKKELNKFFNDFYKYRQEHINATNTKELKSSTFKKFYSMDNGQLSFNLEEIEKRMDLCGFNSLMTNMVSTTDDELVSIYRKRMSIEHSFKKLKSSFDMKAFYKHINATAELKCLVNWLTLMVYNSIKIELQEISSDKQVNAARKYFSKDEESNVDILLSAIHVGAIAEFTEFYEKPNYYIQTTDAQRALLALGLKNPKIDNYGVGFIEQSTRFKKYQSKIEKLYNKLKLDKITEQEFNVLTYNLHMINY